QHGARRGLAVSAGDRQHPFRGEHVLGEPLGPRLEARSRIEDRLHERVAACDHVADHPEIGLERELLGAVALDQLYAKPCELLAHRRIDVRVAAGDAMARLLRDRRDAAHESPANAEDVQVHFAIIRRWGEAPTATAPGSKACGQESRPPRRASWPRTASTIS